MKRREFLRKGLLVGAAGFLTRIESPAKGLSSVAAPPELIRLEKLLEQWLVATQHQLEFVKRGIHSRDAQIQQHRQDFEFSSKICRLQPALASCRFECQPFESPLKKWVWKNADEYRQAETLRNRCEALWEKIVTNRQLLHADFIKRITPHLPEIQKSLAKMREEEYDHW